MNLPLFVAPTKRIALTQPSRALCLSELYSKMILQVLETYQIFFAGILGFSSVIVTMLANAKMQRDQQDREVEHSADSLRAAVRSELFINKQVLELRINQLSAADARDDASVPNTVANEVYRQLLGRIGLLSQVEIASIIEAYLLLQELPYRLKLLVGTDRCTADFTRLNVAHRHAVTQIYSNSLKVIEKAIESIECASRKHNSRL